MTIQTTRRGFLKTAAGAALVIGLRPDGVMAAGDATADLNPFVRIHADGTLEVFAKHFEMGQGTTTGLATLIAEEMDADWSKVTVSFAPADSSRYANLFFKVQGTGGSTAIANSFMQYRTAGAAAREVLVAAAAETWGVAPGDIEVRDSILTAGDHSAHFGAFVARAATLTASPEPALKDPAAFRLIGQDGLPRKDTAAKIDGSAEFAIDVKVPGMVYAVILRSPRFGGTLTGFDASGAASVPGFIDAKALGNGAGVAVYAADTWSAMQACDAVTAEWDFSAAENRSTDALIAEHQSQLDTPAWQTREGGDLDATGAAIDGADVVLAAEFIFPPLAHAPMEPLNCVIEPTATGIRFHDGCQFPYLVQAVSAAVLGIDPGQVDVRTVYAGGSFGRRATPGADYHLEAVLAFAALGAQTPVKLVWTREDDIRGGYYRPMAAHRARIGLTGGQIVGWDHRVAAKPIMKGTPLQALAMPDGSEIDASSVEGVSEPYYAIPAMSVGLSDVQSAMPVLWLRAVGHTHTAYALEVLMDMAAEAAGADPVAFRLGLLGGGGTDQDRLSGVLRLAADKSGWGTALPAGRGRGVAVHKSFNTYVAQVAEVSLLDGAIRIERITCAVDCGTVVNPDVVRAQMEGGIGYGLGAVMRNKITLSDGVVDQSNFPDYEPLRITDMPAVDVHIVASNAAPTGVGEPGLPPAGPALANAIHAVTGKRITRLPMTDHGITFV